MACNVVVTGIGIASSIGIGAEAFWDALNAGRVGVTGVLPPQCAPFSPTAAPVALRGTECSAIAGGRFINRSVQLARIAALTAARDGALPQRRLDPERVAVVLGVGRIEIDDGTCPAIKSWLDIDPLRRLRHLPNIVSSAVAIDHDARAANLTLLGDYTSGLEAVIEGYDLVRSGIADAALCGGVDSRLEAGLLEAIDRLTPLSRHANPRAACRPFDIARSGAVAGEGAAILLLESTVSAARRHVRAYAGIAANTSAPPGDNRHDGLTQLYAAAASSRVDVIVAHGDGTPASDLAEAAAIGQMLIRSGKMATITAIKGHIGHTFAASGSFNAAAACLTVAHSRVPGIPRLERPCADLSFARGESVATTIHRAAAVALAHDGSGAAITVESVA